MCSPKEARQTCALRQIMIYYQQNSNRNDIAFRIEISCENDIFI